MGCCNVVAILSMADMVCLDCMQKLQCMSSAGFVWYVEFTAAEHGRCGSSFMRKTRVNIAE